MKSEFTCFGGIDFSGAREPLSKSVERRRAIEDQKLTIVDLRPHAFRADAAAFVAEGWRQALGFDSQPILWG